MATTRNAVGVVEKESDSHSARVARRRVTVKGRAQIRHPRLRLEVDPMQTKALLEPKDPIKIIH